MSVFKDIRHAYNVARAGWNSRPSLVTHAEEYRNMQQSAFRTAMEAAFKSRRAKNEWYPGTDGEQNVGNYYPGAEINRFRNDWITRIVTSTNLTRLSYRTLASRAEFAYRTNSYIKRAVEIVKTLTVGAGIMPFPMVKNSDGTPAESVNKKLADHWQRFNEQGMRLGSQEVTMLEAQGIEMESMAQLGSVIRQRVPSRKGSWLPFAYTLVKPYRLNFAHDNFFDDLYYRQMIIDQRNDITVLGQQFNKNMEPQGFYILGEKDMVPAERMSIHYRQREPEQYLGFPWVAASLAHSYDVDQLIDDIMTQSRMLARMGIWISKKDKNSFNSDMSYVNGDGGDADMSIALEKLTYAATEEKPEAIMFKNDLTTALEPLLKLELASIAVGMGMSYQLMSSDLTGSSFSGNRMNAIIDSKCFKSVFGSFVKSNCQPSWNDFVEWEILTGKIHEISYSDYLKDTFPFRRCYWLPEEIDWFDPLEKVKAQRLQLQTGIITLQELCEEEGRNYTDVLAQRGSEKKFIKAQNLEEILPNYSEHVTLAAAAETDPAAAKDLPGNSAGGGFNGK
jgi:lambda family phage portal protein